MTNNRNEVKYLGSDMMIIASCDYLQLLWDCEHITERYAHQRPYLAAVYSTCKNLHIGLQPERPNLSIYDILQFYVTSRSIVHFQRFK
jgi:hypothetical protein